MTDFAEQNKILAEKMRELKAQMESLGKAAFKQGSAAIFEAFPELESFQWSQYSPYFNDGDECVFHVNSDFFLEFTDGTDSEDWVDAWSVKYYAEKESDNDPRITVELINAIDGLVSSIDEDVMKELFGNHVSVTVHRDGQIDVDGYDHE